MAKHCPECGTPLTKDQVRRRGTYCSRKCSGRSNKRGDLKRSRTNKGHANSSSKERRSSIRKGPIKVVEQPPREKGTHDTKPLLRLVTDSQLSDLKDMVLSQNEVFKEICSALKRMDCNLNKIHEDISHIICYLEIIDDT